jgi:hypothetical protein
MAYRCYWQEQINRIESPRNKIATTPASQPGRAVPDDEDLVIGQGRLLALAVLFLDISGFQIVHPKREMSRRCS